MLDHALAPLAEQLSVRGIIGEVIHLMGIIVEFEQLLLTGKCEVNVLVASIGQCDPGIALPVDLCVLQIENLASVLRPALDQFEHAHAIHRFRLVHPGRIQEGG